MTPYYPSGPEFQRLCEKAKILVEEDRQVEKSPSFDQDAVWRTSVLHSTYMEGDEPADGILLGDSPAHYIDLRAWSLYQAYRTYEPLPSYAYAEGSIYAAQTAWFNNAASCIGINQGFRTDHVKVGNHVAPHPNDISALLRKLQPVQQWASGVDQQIVVLMALHHRMLYIHPFEDGNGRIARMVLEKALVGLGLSGAWSLSRVLHKRQAEYHTFLANADQPRRGDYDGRGALSESALVAFIDFMLDCAFEALQDK